VEYATGLGLDLSALRTPAPRAMMDDWLRKRVEQEALSLFPRLHARPRKGSLWRRLAEVSDRKAELIGALI
jgi:hypothetical protein